MRPTVSSLSAVILVVFASGCSAARVSSYPVLYLSQTNVKQGDTVEIRCTLSNTQSGDVIQIIKSMVTSVHPSGSFNMSALVEHIMCNNTNLDPFLDEIDRYSISERIVPNDLSIQITITDIQPKDSGTFLCRGMLPGEDPQYTTNTSEAHLTVTGPLRKVEINSPPIRKKYGYGLNEDAENSTLRIEVNEKELSLISGSEVEIECQVMVDHKGKWPIVQAFVDNEEVTLSRSKYDSIHTVGYPGGLVDSFVKLYYFWDMTPSLEQHGKTIRCEAHLPDTWTNIVSTQRTLNITGVPEGGKCDPSYIKAPVGTLNVKLECQAMARDIPVLNVIWYGPKELGQIVSSAEKGHVISMERNGLVVTTSLTIANVTHLGNYKVVWYNDHGNITTDVELGAGEASGSSQHRMEMTAMVFSMLTTLIKISHIHY